MIFPTLDYQEKLWTQGYKYVVGLDEAGRGPLAGPVVAGAALITDSNELIEGVRDSKKASKKLRETLFDLINTKSHATGVGVIGSEIIDEIGIQKAVQLAMRNALLEIESKISSIVDYLLIDGKGVLAIEGYSMDKITKGDRDHYSIAAASILAKVTRDRIMEGYSHKYPEYGFDTHVGYGTKGHIETILRLGPCPIHRKSFKPISELI